MLPQLISKLGHPLEEVRGRALDALSGKLDLKIFQADELCDSQDLFMKLLSWLKQSKGGRNCDILNFIIKLLKHAGDKGANQVKKYGGEEICEELLQVAIGNEKSLLEEIITLLAPGHKAEQPSRSLSMFPVFCICGTPACYTSYLRNQLGGPGIYALDDL
ncbi:unnamed protein product [Darwinula stevensoni]|uniref:Rotatin N-terminal domain-containing protein n=1 Tax=Darwinula stevensoni TaxID=69355 RepID=A0A7R8X2E3_9CRUS|nr:unnamed protein product [Darwinula stevensoni]CAG0881122.1 unnamed protein product [Darwinula stevensoni]